MRPGEWRFRGPPPTDCSSLERGTPFSEGGGVPTAETVVMGLPHRPRFPPTETVSGEGAGELEGDDEPESHIFKRRFHYNKILYRQVFSGILNLAVLKIKNCNLV